MSWVVTALAEGNLLWGLTGGGCAHVQSGLGVSRVNPGVRTVPGEHESYQQEGGNDLYFPGESRRRPAGWLEDNRDELFGTPLA